MGGGRVGGYLWAGGGGKGIGYDQRVIEIEEMAYSSPRMSWAAGLRRLRAINSILIAPSAKRKFIPPYRYTVTYLKRAARQQTLLQLSLRFHLLQFSTCYGSYFHIFPGALISRLSSANPAAFLGVPPFAAA